MSNLSIKLQSIASRNCAIKWDEERKTLYAKQNVDRVAIFKQLVKLKFISIYVKAFEIIKINIKSNTRNMMIDNRVQKNLHNNAFE